MQTIDQHIVTHTHPWCLKIRELQPISFGFQKKTSLVFGGRASFRTHSTWGPYPPAQQTPAAPGIRSRRFSWKRWLSPALHPPRSSHHPPRRRQVASMLRISRSFWDILDGDFLRRSKKYRENSLLKGLHLKS